MSAYRELKSGTVDTTELDAHIETCAACREILASYTSIGTHLLSAPQLTPPPDAHERLMKALAEEQLRALQKAAPGQLPTPEFLKPYLQERAQLTQDEDEIAAFSTAETGPLPLLHTRRNHRSVAINQFTVLGLAASVLLLLMMGGLTSLLMLARTNPASTAFVKNSASLSRESEVDQKVYTTNTLYPNVTSAIPTGQYVYYAASGNGTGPMAWEVLQFDPTTQISTPLLATPSNDPLIVLAASDHWLVWLEYDRPQLVAHGAVPDPTGRYAPDRAWTLNYLALPLLNTANGESPATAPSAASNSQLTPTPIATQGKETPHKSGVSASAPTAQILLQGIFDSATAPSWVSSPISGVWLNGDTLLVAHLDQQGVSSLSSYELGQTGAAASVTIAQAAPGHILTWPSSDTSGMNLYWADEWSDANAVLHSNVWERQTSEQAEHEHSYPYLQSTYTQQLLFDDGMSFQPQVVDETLFFLSTSEVVVSQQGAVQEPDGTPFPTAATDRSVMITPRTDQTVYLEPADAAVHGTIFMLPLDGANAGNESMLGTVGQSTAFQAGSTFIVWQDNTGYRMYDVDSQSEVMLGSTLDNAALLSVNDGTTCWLADNAVDPSGSQLTMMVYNWPA